MNDEVCESPVIAALQAALNAHRAETGSLCVAFSGGIDSSVLLHALVAVAAAPRRVRAMHVNHGLHADASEWARFCESSCAALGVPLCSVQVDIDPTAPGGPEARARDARYSAFRGELKPGEVLVTAHHLQDQAETFFLQVMRGAGPAGLAAMADWRVTDGFAVMRPLLAVEPIDIQAYAMDQKLSWVDDPSNQDTRFDRNYLRYEIFPRLTSRWPAATQVMARSARLSGITAETAAGVAEDALAGMLDDNRLDLTALERLSEADRSLVFRAALKRLGLPLPSEQQLQLALRDLLTARSDAELQFTWRGAALRRYRKHVWLYDEQHNALVNRAAAAPVEWTAPQPIDLGAVAGKLSGAVGSGHGIALQHADKPWHVRFRRGGERLRLVHGGPQRSLKNLLQENGVVPWMRSHIPLICSGDSVLAVGDLWLNVDYQAAPDEPGMAIQWQCYAPFR